MKKLILVPFVILISFLSINVAQQEDVYAGIINVPAIIQLLNSYFLSNGIITNMTNVTFIGDQFFFDVGVIDPNGVMDIRDVFVALINDTNITIQANCRRDGNYTGNISVNLAIDSEIYTVNITNATGFIFNCTYTVENSTYGNYSLGVCVLDSFGNITCLNVTNTTFFNPRFRINISNGPVVFPDGISGQTVTSNTIIVTNMAEDDLQLNITMNMRDLFDPSSSGAICPTSNILRIENIQYNAVSGAMTYAGPLVRPPARQEVIPGLLIGPGESIGITFTLTYPTPCLGNFNTSKALSFFAEVV